MDTSRHLFTVWNVRRTKKVFVVLPETENLYEELILKSSLKLEIDGSALVLEKNGTVIDSSEVLLFLKDEVLVLLQKNEIWLSPENSQGRCNPESMSTITVLDSSSTGTITFDLDKNPSFSHLENTNVGANHQLLIADICEPQGISASNTETLEILNVQNVLSPSASNSSSPTVFEPKSRVNESTWHQFTVPWDKFPSNFLQELNKGERISNNMMNEIVRILVNEMRTIKEHLPQKAIDLIAHKMIAKYPKAFQDTDEDGIILGSGVYTVAKKIQERNAYLNRTIKRKANSPSESPSNKKRRSLLASRAGCTNWQPTTSSRNEESSEEKIRAVNVDNIEFNDDLYQLFKNTYPTQRAFLNNVEDRPTIEKIKSEWPVLVRKEGIFWHYEMLMTHTIDKLELALNEKAEKIIKYGIKKNIECNSVVKKIKVIETVSKLLKEDFEKFLPLHSMNNRSSHVDDIQLNPCVLREDDKFYVSVERLIINPEGDTFMEALKICFACFFIYGMQFPKATSATWEFIQRYFLKVHPDQGTKSQTFLKSKKKVLNLMKNLSTFEM